MKRHPLKTANVRYTKYVLQLPVIVNAQRYHANPSSFFLPLFPPSYSNLVNDTSHSGLYSSRPTYNDTILRWDLLSAGKYAPAAFYAL